MSGGEVEVPEPRMNSFFQAHEDAERAILRTWRSGRVPHAWLIAGPRGIGKATLAFRFARFALGSGSASGGLLNADATSLDCAPDSPVFRQVAAGAHPDLLVLEPGYDEKRERRRTEIVVDDVRRAIEFMHLKPSLGGWRVVLVDSADDMNRNAANALLKILEEPPRDALLLLVSHAPGSLLPTIRSRCRRLQLAPLGVQAMNELIHHYLQDIDSAQRKRLIGIADGSIGRALAIAGAGGLDVHAELMRQLESLPSFDMAELHGFAGKLGKSGAESQFGLASELLQGWLAQAIRAKATGNGASGPTGAPRGGSLEQWLGLWEKIGHLFARTEAVNLDRKQVWIGAMIDIAQLTAAR
jgi:DNA polymerase-3 subunit delta'